MRQGFSLVELSIVLVILGLLTGGILTGQSLIRAAELRSVTTEFQRHQTAVRTFQDKYFALPGDMKNATDFWGTAQAGGGCDTTTAGTGTQTCSGDGDGTIDYPSAASEYGEVFTFWQHLANAGLIGGEYTGMAGSGGQPHAILGINTPSSKISNAGWSMTDLANFSGNGALFAGYYGNTYRFGAETTSSLTQGAVISAEEAWGIDKKMDDGMPATGKLVVRIRQDCTLAADGSAITTSAADATKLDATYKLTETSIMCALFFRNAF